MNKLDISQLKTVIFDWDGTLAETRTPRLWAINQIMAKYGLPDWQNTKQQQNPMLSFMDNFPLVFGEKANQAYNEYFHLYKDNIAQMIKPFPGVKELLSFFYKQGVLISIMTNKDRRLLDYELPLLFSPSIFTRIVCGHEAQHDKPNADHALAVLDGLIERKDISDRTVWVVGDSQLDTMTAQAIKALPIRISQRHEEEINSEVVCFDDFQQFYQAVVEENRR